MLTTRMAYRRHTVTAAEAAANTLTKTFTEIGQIGCHVVQAYRANVLLATNPTVTRANNALTIANTGGGYSLTEGDVLHLLVHEGA